MPYTVNVGHYQKDGSRWVIEIHTDAQGEFARARYLGRDGWDFDAIASERHTRLLESSADNECEQAIEENVMPTLRFQTASEFVSRVREFYRNRDGEALAKVAIWMRDRIQAGDITENQFQSAFGFTQQQWNNFKTTMQNLADSYSLVESAVGQ